MRQVPCYLMIGSGRIAKHFSHYFDLKNITYDYWHRGLSVDELHTKEKLCTHILLAISDRAISHFIQEHFSNSKKIIIHFSGSLTLENGYGVHPLMTFSPDLYTLPEYEKIPFVLDRHAPPFLDLFPKLDNPHFYLDSKMKAKYHALCVLSGNFTTILWQKVFKTFSEEFNLPKEILFPYAKKTIENLIQHSDTALTGPIARQDQTTIKNNLNALDQDPFQAVYQSMVDAYQKTFQTK